jgi:hypothetical protein
MEINDFVNIKNYSASVKAGGIISLLRKWAYLCRRLPYDNKYQLDEYLNDLLTRDVINEILENCNVEKYIVADIAGIDEIFKGKTIMVDRCLWPNDNGKYNATKNWYFFRVPPQKAVDWIPADKAHE